MVEKRATQIPELKAFQGRDRRGPKAGMEVERIVPERQVWVKVRQIGWYEP